MYSVDEGDTPRCSSSSSSVGGVVGEAEEVEGEEEGRAVGGAKLLVRAARRNRPEASAKSWHNGSSRHRAFQYCNSSAMAILLTF